MTLWLLYLKGTMVAVCAFKIDLDYDLFWVSDNADIPDQSAET